MEPLTGAGQGQGEYFFTSLGINRFGLKLVDPTQKSTLIKSLRLELSHPKLNGPDMAGIAFLLEGQNDSTSQTPCHHLERPGSADPRSVHHGLRGG